MILNLTIDLPDDATPKVISAYLREQAGNAAGQIEQGIISIPVVDQSIYIDFDHKDDGRYEALIFRSE